MIWDRTVEFDADDAGTKTKFRRWMKAGAQYGDRTHDLGIGVLPWRSHVKALQVNWIQKYRDASRGEWKSLLDAWFARFPEGRGAVYTSRSVKELTASTTGRASSLPAFWVSALSALREIGVHKAHPLKWELDDVRAHPYLVEAQYSQ